MSTRSSPAPAVAPSGATPSRRASPACGITLRATVIACRSDGLTTQQAALITVVEAAGSPSLSEAADALACTRQNLKQIASALRR